MQKHKTQKVKVDEWEADIDEDLAPLIEQIWKAGFLTVNSCQENHPGIAWIQFFSSEDAAEFISIVAGEYSDDLGSLYNRIRGEFDDPDGPEYEMWEFDIQPQDLAVDQWINDDDTLEEKPTGRPQFVFNCSIRFPRTDIELLLQRMRSHNIAAKSAG